MIFVLTCLSILASIVVIAIAMVLCLAILYALEVGFVRKRDEEEDVHVHTWKLGYEIDGDYDILWMCTRPGCTAKFDAKDSLGQILYDQDES